MMQDNLAQIEVAPELLAKYLHLPEGTEIWAAQVKRGTHGMVVALGVRHPDIPLINEGEVAPVIYPVVTYHQESWDFDWNLPVEHDLQQDDEDYVEPYDS